MREFHPTKYGGLLSHMLHIVLYKEIQKFSYHKWPCIHDLINQILPRNKENFAKPLLMDRTNIELVHKLTSSIIYASSRNSAQKWLDWNWYEFVHEMHLYYH